MTSASRWLHRVELALWVVGACLLGVALGATVYRWNYQAQQERALFQQPGVRSSVSASGVRSSESTPENAETEDLTPDAKTEDLTPNETIGPAAPVAKPLGVKIAEAPKEKIRKVRPPDVDVSVLGRVEIPRLGVRAIIREGADEQTLARAVGLIPGGARPGEVGNTVLAGHRDTFFRPLRKIRVDDRIRILVPPDTYEYRVDSLRVVSPKETSVLDSNGVEELTLITCYPFRYIGPAPDRFIVSASRVN
jgi:sortase A